MPSIYTGTMVSLFSILKFMEQAIINILKEKHPIINTTNENSIF